MDRACNCPGYRAVVVYQAEKYEPGSDQSFRDHEQHRSSCPPANSVTFGVSPPGHEEQHDYDEEGKAARSAMDEFDDGRQSFRTREHGSVT
jgi:hypothetical protein